MALNSHPLNAQSSSVIDNKNHSKEKKRKRHDIFFFRSLMSSHSIEGDLLFHFIIRQIGHPPQALLDFSLSTHCCIFTLSRAFLQSVKRARTHAHRYIHTVARWRAVGTPWVCRERSVSSAEDERRHTHTYTNTRTHIQATSEVLVRFFFILASDF